MNFDMDTSLGFLINRTAIASKACLSEQLKSFDISAEQWSIIFRVVEEKGITQKELSNNTYKDQANITRSINRLEKKEFLYRTNNEKDKRVINIFPTKKAEELVEKIIPISSRHNELLVKDFSLEEQESLIFLINKVYKNINNKEK